jgi:Tol biopolymer transport system component
VWIPTGPSAVRSTRASSSTVPLIAFARTENSNTDIYVMSADGSAQKRLTKSLADDASPSWSPDGQHIAFASNRDDNWAIYVMNADGRSVRKLNNAPEPQYDPAWSRDGSLIAYETFRKRYWRIAVTSSRGGPEKVLPTRASDHFDPTWSPLQPRTLTVASAHGISFFLSELDILKRGERALVPAGKIRGSKVGATPLDGVALFHPAWSPDGRWLAFDRRVGKTYMVSVVRAGGEKPRVHARLLTSGSDPSWSPDGRSLAYVFSHGGASSIFLINPSNGKLRDLSRTNTVDAEPAWGMSAPLRERRPARLGSRERADQLPCTKVANPSGGVVYGSRSNDVLCGGPGNDVLKGLSGDDMLWTGDAGRDVLWGGPGNDKGHDTFLAMDGFRDVIHGRRGDQARVDRGIDEIRPRGIVEP